MPNVSTDTLLSSKPWGNHDAFYRSKMSFRESLKVREYGG